LGKEKGVSKKRGSAFIQEGDGPGAFQKRNRRYAVKKLWSKEREKWAGMEVRGSIQESREGFVSSRIVKTKLRGAEGKVASGGVFMGEVRGLRGEMSEEALRESRKTLSPARQDVKKMKGWHW